MDDNFLSNLADICDDKSEMHKALLAYYPMHNTEIEAAARGAREDLLYRYKYKVWKDNRNKIIGTYLSKPLSKAKALKRQLDSIPADRFSELLSPEKSPYDVHKPYNAVEKAEEVMHNFSDVDFCEQFENDLEKYIGLLEKYKNKVTKKRGGQSKNANLNNFVNLCIEMYETCANKNFTLYEFRDEEDRTPIPVTEGHLFISAAVNIIYQGRLPISSDPKTGRIINDPNTGYEQYSANEIYSACTTVMRLRRNK
jgi:hypothetical protein